MKVIRALHVTSLALIAFSASAETAIWRFSSGVLPPPSDPQPAPPLKNTITDDWRKTLGLKCDVNIYTTDSDLKREKGEKGTGTSQDNPTGVTINVINDAPPKGAGGCTCNIAIEKDWWKKQLWQRKPQVTNESKIAHELCHCFQAMKGDLQSRDTNLNLLGVAPAWSQDDLENGASTCATQLLAGGPITTWIGLPPKPAQFGAAAAADTPKTDIPDDESDF